MKIQSLIKKDTSALRTQVEYKAGIVFTLAYVSREALTALSQKCIVFKYDPKTKVREQTVDGKKFSQAFAGAAVVGWSNVTPRSLSHIVPLEAVAESDMDTEITFSVEGLLDLIAAAYELDVFLQESAVNAELFRPQHEEELGNSETSPSGS